MGLFLPLAIAMAVVLLSAAFFVLSRRRNDNWLPGAPMVAAPPHWLLGHLKELKGKAKSPNLIEGMRKLFVQDNPAKTGLATFWFFQQKAIVIMSSEHVKTAFHSTNHRKPIPLLGKHMTKLLGEKSIALLSTLEPHLWKAHRSMVMEAFHAEHLKQMVGDMDVIADKLIHALCTRIDSSSAQGKTFEFDLFKVLKMATMDTIGLTGFGVDFKCCENFMYSDVAAAFEFLLDDQSTRSAGANILDPRKMFYSWPSEQNRKSKQSRTLLRNTLASLMTKKQAGMESGEAPHVDFLHLMLQARAANKVTDDALVDNLITLLFGGYDTTSIALSYSIYLLWCHPDAQQRCVDEARAVLAEVASGEVTHVQINKLKYITAVFKEAMRLYPPAPVTARHTTAPMKLRVPKKSDEGVDTDTDTDTDTFVTVPEDTLIYIPIWWIHRSPLNWDRPDEFDPTRFLQQDAKDGEAVRRVKAYSWIPFSGGQRNCVGQRFALLEG
jgi:cytochrome P450